MIQRWPANENEETRLVITMLDDILIITLYLKERVEPCALLGASSNPHAGSFG